MKSPSTQRVAAIVDHMVSLGAYTQAGEVLVLGKQRDNLLSTLMLYVNQAKAHDGRVQDLLEANNAYLERARTAEDRVRVLEGRIEKARDFIEGVINGKSGSKEERHDGGESSPAS
jgi:hypothetical protein